MKTCLCVIALCFSVGCGEDPTQYCGFEGFVAIPNPSAGDLKFEVSVTRGIEPAETGDHGFFGFIEPGSVTGDFSFDAVIEDRDWYVRAFVDVDGNGGPPNSGDYVGYWTTSVFDTTQPSEPNANPCQTTDRTWEIRLTDAVP